MDRQEQKDILIWVLKEVWRAEAHKDELTERLMRINAERNAPIGAAGYEPLPRTQTPSAGAASILFKLSEIEDRIYEQKAEIEKSIVRVMDIIDFIPQHEIARRIFELRYIDMKGWGEIADAIPIARSGCYDHHNRAIDKLLDFPKIQTEVENSRLAYLAWCVEREKQTGSKNQSGGIKPGNKSRKKNRKK
jgi:hypothetical protein